MPQKQQHSTKTATNIDVKNPLIRKKYGIICGSLGIFLNTLLFVVKLLTGIHSASIAITADAFNNISDAASSIVTLLGFKLAAKKPDATHPFGHGRIEYIAGLIVSVLIILMGFELFTTSIQIIRNPTTVTSSPLVICILIASILVKLYIYRYNHTTAKKINSPTLKATAKDSLSDTLATLLVLASIIASHYTDIPIDGWAGLVVAIIISYAGFTATKETVKPLLGEAPDTDFINKIEKTILEYEHILGIHDVLVHNYGPGRFIISLHAEVPGNKDIYELHTIIETIEKDIAKKFGWYIVIHTDPIKTDGKNNTS